MKPSASNSTLLLVVAMIVQACRGPGGTEPPTLDGAWRWLLTESGSGADTLFSSGFEYLLLSSDGSFRMVNGSRTPPVVGTYTTVQEDVSGGGLETLIRLSQPLPLLGPDSGYVVTRSGDALRLVVPGQAAITHLFVRDGSGLVCADPANQERCLEWLR